MEKMEKGDYIGLITLAFALVSIAIFLYSCCAYVWQVPNWMYYAWPVSAVLSIIFYFIGKMIEK